MGLLDGLLGGVVGGEMATLVNGFVERHGGVQGIVTQMEQKGMGETVKSWVSTGPNQPITTDQVHTVFGSDMISGLAAKLGLNPQDVASKIAQVLPGVVDKMTPNGVVPHA